MATADTINAVLEKVTSRIYDTFGDDPALLEWFNARMGDLTVIAYYNHDGYVLALHAINTITAALLEAERVFDNEDKA